MRTVKVWALALAVALAGGAGVRAQDLVFNQYSVYRISPAAKYFTPGSIILGYNFNGVMKLELVCRHRVDLERDDNLLKDRLESAGFFQQKGFEFSAGARVVELLNAEFGGSLVRNVTMSATDVTIYEYSAEDLATIRKQLLSRPACAQAIESPRYQYRANFNDAPAGLFQNRRFAIGNLSYKVEFNKDNPRAASVSIQAAVTKKLQVKFGLSHLSASTSELRGENVVLGVYPLWQPSWD